MNVKNLLIAIAILFSISLFTWWSTQPKKQTYSADEWIGKALLSPEVVRDTSHIALSWETNQTELRFQKAAQGWVLETFHNVPVAVEKLKAKIDDLLEAKVMRKVSANPDVIARLQIGKVKIDFLNQSQESLLTILLGKEADNGESYISINRSDIAYAIDEQILFQEAQSNWIDKTVLSLTSEDVKAIAFISAEENFTLQRKSKDDPFASDATDVDSSKVNDWLQDILLLNYTSIIAEENEETKEALSHAKVLTLTSFDEKTYTLTFGRTPEQEVVTEVPAPEDKEEESTPAEPTTQTETIPAGTPFLTYSLPENAGDWLAPSKNLYFEIRPFSYEDLDKSLADFAKEEEEKEDTSTEE